MAKLLLILLIGLIFEAAGVVLLKKGITQIGDVKASQRRRVRPRGQSRRHQS